MVISRGQALRCNLFLHAQPLQLRGWVEAGMNSAKFSSRATKHFVVPDVEILVLIHSDNKNTANIKSTPYFYSLWSTPT